MSTMFYLNAFFAFSLKPHKLTLTSKGLSSVRGECQLGNSAVSDGQTYINNRFLLQCNLDLVTLLVSSKNVTKSHNVTKWNDFM